MSFVDATDAMLGSRSSSRSDFYKVWAFFSHQALTINFTHQTGLLTP
jgi:hypothetical protein